MLKAVRFDENKHKDLINFFSNFRDKNNKINESEGIRYLMELGYAELTKPQPIDLDPPPNELPLNPFNILDVGDLKEELRKQILEELQNNNLQTAELNPSINIENLKKELLNEVMNQVNSKTFDNLNSLIDKLGNIQPIYMTNPEPSRAFTEMNTPPEPTIINNPKPTIDIPADINPLLANMIANANR